MSWEEELETASFDGVEFDVQKTTDSLMRRWSEHTYPFKDGADIDDMGREARPTKLTAVFIGQDASERLGKLVLVVDRGETATFQHPLFGSWQAKMRIPSIDAVHSFRDGYVVELEVKEDGTATELPTIFSIDTMEDTISGNLEEVSAAVSAVQAAGAAWDAAVSAVNDAIDAVNDLVNKAKSYAAKVEQAVNKVRSTIQKAQRALNNAITSATKIFAVTNALMKTGASCLKLARSVTSSAPSMHERVIKAASSTALLAQDLYGDGSRRTEIESANNVRNPAMISSGEKLSAPSK
jgi:prophage DNA circulation protein